MGNFVEEELKEFDRVFAAKMAAIERLEKAYEKEAEDYLRDF